MKTLKSAIPFFLLLIFSFQLHAQKYTTVKNASKKIYSQYSHANKLITQNYYPDAIAELNQLTKDVPDFIDAWLLIGELYNDQNEFVKGKDALLKVISLDPQYASKTWFFLANSYWQIDSFEACSNACKKFLTFQTISVERKKQTDHLLLNANFCKEAILHPVPFDPKNLGSNINSDQPEYLPSLTGDEQTIVFTRRLGNGALANEDFFISKKRNNEWQPAQSLSGNVNTTYNEGAQSLTPDGNILYYAACDKPGGYGSCDIYFTKRIGNDWTAVKNAGPPVCTNSWETQPCISADGNALYFVSNRDGGKGGSDIWVSYKETNGRWKTPINLGDSVNTPYDEKSPFIHADGSTLYFSSNGHAGFGGDDIFICRKKSNSTWSSAANIGTPINSKKDENSFVVSLSGEHAYFASDRLSERKNYDLYYFNLYKEARPVLTTFIKGTIVSKASSDPVSAKVEMIDLETGKIVGESISDPVDGGYLVSIPNGKDYALNVSAKNFLFYSANFSLKDHSAENPFLLNVKLEAIAVGNTVVLNNIFYKTDSYQIEDASKVELNKLIDLLNQNASIKIQIGGHTDNVGDNAHNQKLSEARAKSVQDFLLANGVAAARLSYKGFGETKPIASNDNEDGRSKNRRTEFTVTAQ